MNLKILSFFCSLLFVTILNAQIEPAPNAVLHTTEVYFQQEFVEGAKKYKLLLLDSSDRRILITQESALPAFWVKNLAWGRSYEWYIRAIDSAETELKSSDLGRFRIQQIHMQNVAEVKLSIRKNLAQQHAGGLVAIDYTRSIFSRDGTPVWTIPVQDTLMDTRIQVRDMKITKENTVTFLTGKTPLEIDMEGNIVWSAPYPFFFKGDSITYHHEFQKTERGTYLILAFRRVYRKVLGQHTVESFENQSELKLINNELHKKSQMTVLLEFNKEGKLIWFWDSNDHLTEEDLNFKKNARGVPNFATHANAFSENKSGTKVYVGFRDLNRIVRVDKKSKRVDLSFGEKYPSGHGKYAQRAFRRQHGAHVTAHNSILVFNNNSIIKDSAVASVVELKDNPVPGDSAILWQLALDFDSIKGKAVSGGNVYELPNKNLLVCAGTFNRVFEVTRNKQIVWDAFVFSRGVGEVSWQAAPQYRCSWTNAIKRYRFMLEASQGTVQAAGKKTIKLTVFNSGTVADRYRVEVVDEKNKILATVLSDEVKAGEKSAKTLTLKDSGDSSKRYIVVKSMNSNVRHSLTIAPDH